MKKNEGIPGAFLAIGGLLTASLVFFVIMMILRNVQMRKQMAFQLKQMEEEEACRNVLKAALLPDSHETNLQEWTEPFCSWQNDQNRYCDCWLIGLETSARGKIFDASLTSSASHSVAH